jgi:biotin carboxyl carrier protein
LILDATVAGRTLRVEVRIVSGRLEVSLAGRPIDVDYLPSGAHFASLLVDGRSFEVGLLASDGGYTVFFPDDTLEVQLQEAARAGAAPARKAALGPARLVAPMPGKVVKVLLAAGGDAALGQGLVVIEAMKMENELRAPRAGRVREIHVSEGQAVETGALLVVID